VVATAKKLVSRDRSRDVHLPTWIIALNLTMPPSLLALAELVFRPTPLNAPPDDDEAHPHG
jgi:hypothetical protein